MVLILTECSAILDIPTPAVVRAHPHLEAIAEKIPELDPEAEILLLVGRDAPPLHKILDKGRPSFLLPCSNRLYVKHGSHADSTTYLENSKKKGTFFEGSF